MPKGSDSHGGALRAPAWLTPSVAALIAANLFPLYGVVVHGWPVFPVVFLFWLENVTVGVFNVLRMLAAEPRDPAAWVAKIFLVPFFTFHYGMFTLVHGVFVFALFGQEAHGAPAFPTPAAALQAVGAYRMAPALLALAGSHAFSFCWNFLGKGEYRRSTPQQLMGRPYARVVVLHVAIILGGFVVVALGSPVGVLVILVGLKVAVDVAAHLHEHRAAAAAPAATRRARR